MHVWHQIYSPVSDISHFLNIAASSRFPTADDVTAGNMLFMISSTEITPTESAICRGSVEQCRFHPYINACGILTTLLLQSGHVSQQLGEQARGW